MSTKIPFLYTSLLYICAFILFLEWLYPVNQIGDVTNMTVFIIYTLFCFFISMLGVKWWLSMPLKGFGLLFVIDSLFMAPPMLSRMWVEQLLAELGFNLNALFAQQWYEMTPLFRSVLFLLLIWMLSYLLYYWFIVMKRIFIFILLTFIYLSLLDTFTVYDANAAIVRTFIVSFTALGMSNFFKEMNRESIRFPWVKKAPVWVVPLAAVVLFSTLIGYAAPKFDSQWPDPVPFIHSAAENAGGLGNGAGIQKVGYGENDSRLGGSFVQDYSPVFQAAAQDEHYWRVETKDVYTGKGWEKSRDPQFELQQHSNITFTTFSENVETEEFNTILDFQDERYMEKLVYPYGISQVEPEENVDLQLENRFGEIRTERNGDGIHLDQYTITYETPSFAIDELREASPEDDPETIKEHYTQLPDDLPDRVGELAADVTEADNNRYDQARSIESYFGRNGFAYQISDVPVPEENQDYVDQFLFESQVGYCDNYSTSMVVLLRSLDIPARWVKGFTSGEVVQHGDTEDDYDIYEVTNANAHSWVEVYFPGSGWVPFEPTQGFSNLTDFHMNLDETDQDDTEDSPDLETPEEQSEEQLEEEETTPAAAQNDNNFGNFEMNWWYVLISVAVASLIVFLFYRTRFRWKTAYLFRKLQRRNDAKTFQDAYHCLLDLLAHQGLAKKPDQTLREFANRIDARYSTDTMNHLTKHYEQILYKNEVNDQETVKLSQLWKNLMKQIMA
ncbi:Transglutaminase-like enzyme, putative cysteine protease [Lentibacillus halodurans]|uniref:Transglutaminase-like enzyme, putative cysteine protease n=1 Tax=Lentibacillus halodurans TaxID=237679 RepID=A0A1I0YLW6_9BACI|nr:transglutaminase domain-containing protein [Lentibacillus halodurans]SFB14405.1 Transglutaminase-like enzyme, putative cysteine protease [Lentibacillus halodurans]